MTKKLWTATKVDSEHEIRLLQDCQVVIESAIASVNAEVHPVERADYKFALKNLERIQEELAFWLLEQDKSVDKTHQDELETFKRMTDAAKCWNGIENPSNSTTVTISFDSHEQARIFAQQFGHLLWLAWAKEAYASIVGHQSEDDT